ncbi:MAG TPA: hypothetical protein H9837_02560 [Candidatus Brachybacterium merdigallinarum]|nr:hypothetical protein [Candidatus Brachybacterium merdigallinarum]
MEQHTAQPSSAQRTEPHTAQDTAQRNVPSAEKTPRKDGEFLGPPRPGRRSVFSLIAFGLLLTATLAIDGFTDVPPMPGTALIAAGFMLLLGVAELLDPTSRRLVIGVRFGGVVMALLGLVVKLVG